MRYLPPVLVSAVVVLVDQLTKALVTRLVHANGGAPIKVLGGKVWIDLTHNTGAAFGILPNQTFLFIGIALAVVAGIVISYRRISHGPIALRLALGLVLGGALGNLIDRLRFGYVVDFIDLRWWPVFNVADSCIVIGVLFLALTLSFQVEKR